MHETHNRVSIAYGDVGNMGQAKDISHRLKALLWDTDRWL